MQPRVLLTKPRVLSKVCCTVIKQTKMCASGKHVHEMYTPNTPLLYNKMAYTGVKIWPTLPPFEHFLCFQWIKLLYFILILTQNIHLDCGRGRSNVYNRYTHIQYIKVGY